MTLRKIESGFAYFTLGALAIYIPVETWTSLPGGLLTPNYLIDAVAMALLLFGAVDSLRARPRPAPAVLCAAFAWTAANGWRATSWRYYALRDGGQLDFGADELSAVAIATALALVCFASTLVLVVKAGRPNE